VRAAAPLALMLSAACSPFSPWLGPEGEVELVLRRMEQSPPPVEVRGAGTLALAHLRFDRVLVRPEGRTWLAVATVDASGTLRGPFGPVQVSCLGRERIGFARAGGIFAPVEGPVPTLAEALSVLLARHRALAGGDVDALEPLVARAYRDPRGTREQALARARERDPGWAAAPGRYAVRLDRAQVEVLEEAATPSLGPRQSNFTLIREEGALRFASGLL
jgi:hypothetical protein